MIKANTFTAKQLLFKELFVGTLIYAVTLGFFNDYTDLVDVKSFSTIFLAALTLQVLTYSVLLAKKKVIATFQTRKALLSKPAMVFCVWLIMFSSKFVFIWVIDFLVGSNVTINGFFAILLLALSATLAHKLADLVFVKLGTK